MSEKDSKCITIILFFFDDIIYASNFADSFHVFRNRKKI